MNAVTESLVLADLDAVLERDDHHGFGYATRRYLGTIVQRELDGAVIQVANELRLNAEQLFEWADSKHGRWLVDAVYGRGEPATVEIVRGTLSHKTLAEIGIVVDDASPLDLQLSFADAGAIADALETLAAIDEGEHTDYDELMQLAGTVREQIVSAKEGHGPDAG